VSRIQTVFSVLVLVLPAACAGPSDWTPGPGSASIEDPGQASGLSPAARRVSQMARQSGDKDFLVLDKVHGKITIFEGGKPTFSGAALTGENTADRFPPDAYGKTFAEARGLQYKVTPAGRYTVSVGFDPSYGDTLDVNEIQGKDWDVAIHRVWLGAPAEHRDMRLRSSRDVDKHITYGCIDVDENTMQQLLARLSDDESTPLYILPTDESLIIKLFQPRDAVRKTSTPTG
jgi:hypothetical protein